MICPSCRDQKHNECPSVKTDLDFSAGLVVVNAAGAEPYPNGKKKGDGLSPAASALQRAALCTCQHRVGN